MPEPDLRSKSPEPRLTPTEIIRLGIEQGQPQGASEALTSMIWEWERSDDLPSDLAAKIVAYFEAARAGHSADMIVASMEAAGWVVVRKPQSHGDDNEHRR